MSEAGLERFSAEHLQEFCEQAFVRLDIPASEARTAAEILVMSDLRGIDSHGVARLKSYYDLLAEGRVNTRPNMKILRESLSTATVDGDNGLGLVVGPWANEIALEKAATAGTGWVAVSNTNHYGIAGYYVLKALERDMIGWAMTNTSRIAAPLGGIARMLGSNPLAIAFPGLTEPPIVIDMATLPAAFGKIEMAYRRQEPIPEGWAIDREGHVTTDPAAMIDGGAMLPLGVDRARGAHKGYCLTALVDILCGPLSGANWGPFTPGFALSHSEPARRVGRGIGHFFGAMSIAAFIDVDEFKRQIDDWIQTFRSAPAAPGTSGPLIPGDPERAAEAKHRQQGIPLLPSVVAELREIGSLVGVPFDRLGRA